MNCDSGSGKIVDLASRRRQVVVTRPSSKRCRAMVSVLLLLLLPTSATGIAAFVGGIVTTSRRRPVPSSSRQQRNADETALHRRTHKTTIATTKKTTTSTSLSAFRVNVLSPNQSEAVELGIREWPQQTRRGSWTESVQTTDDTATLVRYILDGKGVVEISSTSDDSQRKEVVNVGPGTMVEITGGPASVLWRTTPEDGEMIVLTPGFEQLGQLAGVAGVLVVLCIALFVGLGG